VTKLLAEKKIPEPVARLRCGPIWSESQLEEVRYAWKENPRQKMDPQQVKQMTLQRRLGELDRRWKLLVKAMAEGQSPRADVIAIWEGKAAVRRHKQGRSALATRHETRSALAEAKLLRMVADLRDEHPVFRGIATELDEAANLRQKLKTLKKARAKRAREGLRVQ
jgi:hypothetical protein